MNNQAIQQLQAPPAHPQQWRQWYHHLLEGNILEQGHGHDLPEEVVSRIVGFAPMPKRRVLLYQLMPTMPTSDVDDIINSTGCKRSSGTAYNIFIFNPVYSESYRKINRQFWHKPGEAMNVDTNFGTIRVNIKKVFRSEERMAGWHWEYDAVIVPFLASSFSNWKDAVSSVILLKQWCGEDLPMVLLAECAHCNTVGQQDRLNAMRQRSRAAQGVPYLVVPRGCRQEDNNFEEAVLNLVRRLSGHGDALHFLNFPENPAVAEALETH